MSSAHGGSEWRYDRAVLNGGRVVSRHRVTVSPVCRSGASIRPVVIDRPNDHVSAGRSAQLRLPHVSGADNEFLSGRAVGVGLDQVGRAYLVNLSQSHELVIRPWGLGTPAEIAVPPRQGDSPMRPQYLERGSFWVRNGRHWDPRYARFGTPLGDDRTSWVLVQVDVHDLLAALVPHTTLAGDNDRAGGTVQVELVKISV